MRHSLLYAQLLTGMHYIGGIGVETNPELGFEWMSRAADLEFPKGVYMLANCYECGMGVEADEEKAHELFIKAAVLGEPEAIKRIIDFL